MPSAPGAGASHPKLGEGGELLALGLAGVHGDPARRKAVDEPARHRAEIAGTLEHRELARDAGLLHGGEQADAGVSDVLHVGPGPPQRPEAEEPGVVGERADDAVLDHADRDAVVVVPTPVQRLELEPRGPVAPNAQLVAERDLAVGVVVRAPGKRPAWGLGGRSKARSDRARARSITISRRLRGSAGGASCACGQAERRHRCGRQRRRLRRFYDA